MPALILAGLIVFFGIRPNELVRWSETTTTAMVAAIPTIQIDAAKVALK